MNIKGAQKLELIQHGSVENVHVYSPKIFSYSIDLFIVGSGTKSSTCGLLHVFCHFICYCNYNIYICHFCLLLLFIFIVVSYFVVVIYVTYTHYKI